MRRFLSLTVSLTIASVLLTSCRKDEIVTYRIIKDPAPASAPAASAATLPGAADFPAGAVATPSAPAALNTADRDMANTAVPTAVGPGLAWSAPARWSAGPERPMRKATFLILGEAGAAGAELAITAFPGDVGGNLANVNRWRQQLSLPPIGDVELGTALQHLHVGELHIDYVELVGPGTPPALRVLGALVPYSGSTWFFKLTGPADLVAREKDEFVSFLRTLRPSS